MKKKGKIQNAGKNETPSVYCKMKTRLTWMAGGKKGEKKKENSSHVNG